jgi:putative membrane protein
MMNFVLRVVIGALGLWLAAEVVPGIDVRDGRALLAAALLLGIVNAILRPIAVVLTLPLSIVTLGFFLLVINAAMLGLVAWLLDDFQISSFWSALFGSIVVSVTSWFAWRLIGPRGRDEVVIRNDRL